MKKLKTNCSTSTHSGFGELMFSFEIYIPFYSIHNAQLSHVLAAALILVAYIVYSIMRYICRLQRFVCLLHIKWK